MAPRVPTKDEKKMLKELFSGMDVETVMISREADSTYNCLAWTLGMTDSWVWPWTGQKTATKAEFDALYKKHGFESKTDGPIASFGLDRNKLTHGSISGTGHGTRWESKLGQGPCIQHKLGEVTSPALYGSVQGFYAKTALRLDGRPVLAKPQPAKGKVMKLSKDEALTLAQAAERVPQDLRNRFGKSYAGWVADCAHPAIAFSSSPAYRTYSLNFLELITLGPAVLPLLMLKLYEEPDGFFALVVVDRLLPPALVVSFEPDDDAVLAGEQGRARDTVKRWLSVT